MAELVRSHEYSVYDNLIAGNGTKFRTKVVTLAACGTTLQPGTVLGKITKEDDAEKGSYKIVDATKTDGTQFADCVLADSVNAIEKINAVAYMQGEFNREALSVADGDALDAHEEELRKVQILLTSVRGKI